MSKEKSPPSLAVPMMALEKLKKPDRSKTSERNFVELVNQQVEQINAFVTQYNNATDPTTKNNLLNAIERKLQTVMNAHEGYSALNTGLHQQINRQRRLLIALQEEQSLETIRNHDILIIDCAKILNETQTVVLDQDDQVIDDYRQHQYHELDIAVSQKKFHAVERMRIKFHDTLRQLQHSTINTLFQKVFDPHYPPEMQAYLERLKTELRQVSVADRCDNHSPALSILRRKIDLLQEHEEIIARCNQLLDNINSDRFKLGPQDAVIEQYINAMKQRLNDVNSTEELVTIEHRLQAVKGALETHASRFQQLSAIYKDSQFFPDNLSDAIDHDWESWVNLPLEERLKEKNQNQLQERVGYYEEYKKWKATCLKYLNKIENTKVSEQDTQMREFLAQQRQMIAAATDINSIQKVAKSLIVTALHLPEITQTLINISDSLRQRSKQACTVGMVKKADRIERALCDIPVQSRHLLMKAIVSGSPPANRQLVKLIDELKRFRTLSFKQSTTSFKTLKARMQELWDKDQELVKHAKIKPHQPGPSR